MNMTEFAYKAVFIALVFQAVFCGITVYFAVSTFNTGTTLKENSEVYQYKTIEQHLVNIEQLLKEIKEGK